MEGGSDVGAFGSAEAEWIFPGQNVLALSWQRDHDLKRLAGVRFGPRRLCGLRRIGSPGPASKTCFPIQTAGFVAKETWVSASLLFCGGGGKRAFAIGEFS